MPGLDSEALDIRAASESFAAFRKLGSRDLETLRLLTEHQGRKNLFEAQDPPIGQDVMNVWFPGVHSDVGGGYPDAEGGLSKVTLLWMLREAKAAGLLTDRTLEEIELGRLPARTGAVLSHADPAADIHKSLHGGWWLFEVLPRKRWDPKSRSMKWFWGPGRRRQIPNGSLLHESVEVRSKVAMYRPPNLPPSYTIVP